MFITEIIKKIFYSILFSFDYLYFCKIEWIFTFHSEIMSFVFEFSKSYLENFQLFGHPRTWDLSYLEKKPLTAQPVSTFLDNPYRYHFYWNSLSLHLLSYEVILHDWSIQEGSPHFITPPLRGYKIKEWIQ